MRITYVGPGGSKGPNGGSRYIIRLDQPFPWDSDRDPRAKAKRLRVVKEQDTSWLLVDVDEAGHLGIECDRNNRVPIKGDKVEWVL